MTPSRVAASLRASTAIRIARSRSSGGYFLGAGIPLFLPRVESLHHPRNETTRTQRPDGAPVYVILDNLSAHKGPAIRTWTRRNKVELCFTLTYTSWASPIEARFGPLRQFIIANSHRPKPRGAEPGATHLLEVAQRQRPRSEFARPTAMRVGSDASGLGCTARKVCAGESAHWPLRHYPNSANLFSHHTSTGSLR